MRAVGLFCPCLGNEGVFAGWFRMLPVFLPDNVTRDKGIQNGAGMYHEQKQKGQKKDVALTGESRRENMVVLVHRVGSVWLNKVEVAGMLTELDLLGNSLFSGQAYLKKAFLSMRGRMTFAGQADRAERLCFEQEKTRYGRTVPPIVLFRILWASALTLRLHGDYGSKTS